MKQKISISIEQETLRQVQDAVETGVYRNNSHLIEMAVNKLLEERK